MTADIVDSEQKSGGMLDLIERVGNLVPHPVIMFLYLIIFIMILSHILYLAGISVTEDIAVPVPIELLRDLNNALGGTIIPYDVYTQAEAVIPDFIIKEEFIPIQSLITSDGIRFIFSSFVRNFQVFGVVAVVLIAMLGAGVAEESGLMNTLIRKLVAVSPAALLAFIIILVGVLSSVATDAGYLILIPLGAAAFMSMKRHPIAGVAAAFAGVSAIFGVNVLITPLDAMLTEITNEAIGLTGGAPITVMANYFFAFASVILMSVVAVIVTQRIIEPRLGTYQTDTVDDNQDSNEMSEADRRGLKGALYGFLGVAAVVAFFTLPPNAPLRDPVTGAVIGATPFMDSLIFIIALIFLVAGIGYGIGAKTFSDPNDVIKAVTKTFAGLAGLLFMFLMISQFIAFFNFTNIPRVAAVLLANALEQAAIGPLPLLVGLILVITLLNFILPAAIPKWAIFAPIFIPLFVRLDVAPQTVLAAYRIGDSPTNIITPLMVYLPFVLTVVQRYDKKAGIGTLVALMLPYVLWIGLAWIALFVLWYVLGLPLGPGYPVGG
ncbi:MAG: AbgT family transporter [Chloroflexota bacterium]|jgi:aminobenzoyl-glutamate transport protein